MNLPVKISAIMAILILCIVFKDTGAFAADFHKTADRTDTSAIREVLVSQQMFVTQFSPGKRKLPKGKKDINTKASLQGVFKVVEMGKDSTHVLTDWIRCPANGCPAMGTYTFGTPGYRKLDTMIAVSKKNSLNEQKRFAKMVAAKK